MSNNWSAKSDQVSVWDIGACVDNIEGFGFNLTISLRKNVKWTEVLS